MNLSDRGRWLIDRYLDDGLAPAEIAELEQLLQDDPETAATFVCAARLDAALCEDLATDRDAAALEALFRREEELSGKLPVITSLPPPLRTDETPILWTAWSRWVPTAVIVAAAVLIAVALFVPRGEESPPTAKVLSGTITVDGKAVQEVPVERALTVAGRESATLQFVDGSRMTVQPESQAILHRPEGEIRQRVELQKGQAKFAVEKAAGSFRVETAEMRLIVGGTEFTVRVVPAIVAGERRTIQRTEISVASGRVYIQTDGEPVALNGGQRRVFPGEEPDRPRPKVRDEEEHRNKVIDPRRGEREPPKREPPKREEPRLEEPRREVPRKEGGDAPRREGPARPVDGKRVLDNPARPAQREKR